MNEKYNKVVSELTEVWDRTERERRNEAYAPNPYATIGSTMIVLYLLGAGGLAYLLLKK